MTWQSVKTVSLGGSQARLTHAFGHSIRISYHSCCAIVPLLGRIVAHLNKAWILLRLILVAALIVIKIVGSWVALEHILSALSNSFIHPDGGIAGHEGLILVGCDFSWVF